MKTLLLLVSLMFGSTLFAIEPGAMKACNEIFNTQDYRAACSATNASFETINGCNQVDIITMAGDMLSCIKTQASFETINGCNKIGFKSPNLINECIGTRASFITINDCNRFNKTRNANDIIACIKAAL